MVCQILPLRTSAGPVLLENREKIVSLRSRGYGLICSRCSGAAAGGNLLLQKKFYPVLSQPNGALFIDVKSKRNCTVTCFFKTKDKLDTSSVKKQGSSEEGWPILQRWDVPWKWQTVVLTIVGCGVSFTLAGLVVAAAFPYLGLQAGELSLDEKAEVLFFGQFIATVSVLGVLYGITNPFQPFADDIFRYDFREPFKLKNGWLLWAGIGMAGALGGIALTGVVMNTLNGESPQRETDALVRLLPLIGSSSISTLSLVGITGVLAPILEETVFRGFLMVSLTKWVPTPVSALISAAVFAVAHLTPGEFPQLFVLGTILGFSYAQTRNLLTPITIHALWNSGVILLLTFLQLQGYAIEELLRG